MQGLRNEQLLTSDYFGLSSTSDPEFERLLDRYAAVRSKGNIYAPTDREMVDKLAQEISRVTMIGNSPAEQVIAEALTEFLIKRRARRIDRKELREEAVQTVLSALETAFEDEIDDIR
ncbi:hypothetical protein AWV80_04055 [Cupriavidus sp. UYMU48A]|nr:hypothetical protein AWV80_04055 [Cupriavidus sp. UYMU48A]